MAQFSPKFKWRAYRHLIHAGHQAEWSSLGAGAEILTLEQAGAGSPDYDDWRPLQMLTGRTPQQTLTQSHGTGAIDSTIEMVKKQRTAETYTTPCGLEGTLQKDSEQETEDVPLPEAGTWA